MTFFRDYPAVPTPVLPTKGMHFCLFIFQCQTNLDPVFRKEVYQPLLADVNFMFQKPYISYTSNVLKSDDV